jgi:hypothetical protein
MVRTFARAREPAFDIRVIRRYFPDFDDAFPNYLARLGGKPGKGA